MTLVPIRTANPCGCDFCAGKKHWDDNWCPQCGDNQLQPPRWWEDLDVCDSCEQQNNLRRGTP